MRKEAGTLVTGLLVLAWAMAALDQPQQHAADANTLTTPDATAPDGGVEADTSAGDPTPPPSPPQDSPSVGVTPADSSPPTDSAAVRSAESPAPTERLAPEPPQNTAHNLAAFVHRITMRNGHRLVSGSGVHVGDGVYLTCRHGFDRGWSVEIDDRAVAAHVSWGGPDFAVIRTQRPADHAAPISTDALADEQPLHLFGMTTGQHVGTLTPTRWTSGSRSALCDSAVDHGDSGGGVFTPDGRLVGIITAKDAAGAVETWFTPLAQVAALLAPFSPAAGSYPKPPGADNDIPSPCVLKFGATWCGPCRTEKISDWLKASNWTIVEVDTDRERNLADEFDVDHIPTFVVIRNHVEVARYTGVDINAFLPTLKAAVLK